MSTHNPVGAQHTPSPAQPTPTTRPASTLPSASPRAAPAPRPESGPTPLPPGWRWARLVDVCKVDPSVQPDPASPFVGLEHIESETGTILSDTDKPPSFLLTYGFDDTHVLYGKLRPYLNKVALPTFSGRCTTEILPFRPLKNCDREFLAWLLRRHGTVAWVMSEKTGTRMPRASIAHLLRMPIPLPPLPEQRRIAAILGEAMDHVRRARAAALARLEAARALPAAFLRSVFESEEAQSGSRVRLGDVCLFKNGLNFTAGEQGYSVKVVGVKDFQRNTYVPMESLDEISLATPPGADSLLKEGDLLFVRSNGSADLVGRSMIVPKTDAAVSFSGFTIRARIEDKRLNPLFCAYLFKAADIGEKMKTVGRGVNIRNLSQGILREIQIPLPPVEVQKLIVHEIERVPELAAQATALAESELATIDALPQAILRRAFAGEL